MTNEILMNASSHHIIDCLKDLKFSRPAWVQWAIDKCIADIRQTENSTGNAAHFNPDIITEVWKGATDMNKRKFSVNRDIYGFNVIDRMICIICGKEWTAVFPDSANQLECPNCHYLNSIKLEE